MCITKVQTKLMLARERENKTEILRLAIPDCFKSLIQRFTIDENVISTVFT